ncbi:hypothetical protein K435DRAFT_926855 [Dendrothele bispora CBS 962.96]|uniref:FAD/NAD(P)-binding domain-containing protein n=1 Tax=Dendrothele bispora (strain CBS 962.96) TaxID=1314807 RepID=A0A4S8MGD4_DENBC|nr:hypothetical protein K435DRAFT_926855 [Dendrothele bispora CBS 962.96]
MSLGCISVFGSQPAIYLAQASLNSVLFEGFMGNGFAAGGQRTATVNESSALELMDKFREQPLRFSARIITETISKIDLSTPRTEEPETADTIIVGTGASTKESALELFRFSGTNPSSCHVIGGTDSAAEEATFLVRRNKLRASRKIAKRLVDNPIITMLWNTVAIECQSDSELLKHLRIRNVQRESFSTKNQVTNPQQRSFRTQLQTDPDGYIVIVPGMDSDLSGDVQDKGYRQAITSAGSGCMAVLEAETPLERLIGEEEWEKGMMEE